MKNSQKSSILIIALWALSVLTVFALYLGFTTRQKILVAKRLNERHKLPFLAESAIKLMISEFHQNSSLNVNTLADPWFNNENKFRDRPIGEGTYTISYNTFSEELGRLRKVYGVVDEERKINMNKANQSIIRRLFLSLGFDKMEAQNLAAAIVDWRDKDSELSIPLGSAEDRYYKNLESPYEAKDSDFETLEELFLVRWMDKATFDKIKNFITVYGNGKVNINTASSKVLLSLGLYESVVKKILIFRKGEDMIEGTADDNSFSQPQNAAATLSQLISLSPSEAANLNNVISATDAVTKSSNFTIISESKIGKNSNPYKIICVYQPFLQQAGKRSLKENYKSKYGEIKYWREE